MNIRGHDIGVCSWSLRAKDLGELAGTLRQLGVRHVQLALAPLLGLDEQQRRQQLDHLRSADIEITAGMMSFQGEDYSTIAMIRRTGGFVPDDFWEARRERALAGAKLAADLGIKGVTSHIGFVPVSSDAAYAKIAQRVSEVAEAYAALGLELHMETGQETASELLQFLNDLRCRNVGVNFDPANMILYGAGDPIEAIRTLSRHIRHVHVKDATISDQPGTKWGAEVPFGTGQVPPRQFLLALDEVGYKGPLAIEREAGDDRVGDIRTAIETLKSLA
jgi:L-ribulose-5-phosphate 3-epimerase